MTQDRMLETFSEGKIEVIGSRWREGMGGREVRVETGVGIRNWRKAAGNPKRERWDLAAAWPYREKNGRRECHEGFIGGESAW